MNIKKLLPVLLLAILTMGAVSASDDISDDGLAVYLICERILRPL